MRKIVTHLGQAHRDDFYACCVALAQNGMMPVIRCQPTEEDLTDTSVLVLDIGGQWIPERNCFDHHQEAGLPCAFHMYMMHLGLHDDAIISLPWYENLNLQDTAGLHAVEQKYGLEAGAMMELSSPAEQYLLQKFQSYTVEVGSALKETMLEIGLNIRSRIEYVRVCQRDFALDVYVAVVKGKFVVRYTNNRFDAFFPIWAKDKDIDVVISPSLRGGWAAKRWNDAPGIDYRKVVNTKTNFVHKNNGFMCVCDTLDACFRATEEAIYEPN